MNPVFTDITNTNVNVITDLNSGTYLVSINYHGFIFSESITIPEVCTYPSTFNNSSVSALAALPVPVISFDNSMGTIKLNGTFTIDADFTFNNAHIIMGPNAIIRILSGAVLNIDNATIIESCCLSWQGIYVNHNAGITVRNSTIKHAHIAAIRSFGNPLIYEITANKFINNQTALWIQPAGNSTSDNNLHLQYEDYENALIAANDFINDEANNLIIQYDNQPNYLRGKNGIRFWNYRQTNAGIVNGVEDVIIPLGNSSMNKNRFMNLKTLGISVINASANIISNHFTHLPLGIYYLDQNGFEIQTSLNVGDETNPPADTTLAYNSFFNCITGINVTKKYNPVISIRGNFFNASHYNNQDYALYANVIIKGERCHISYNGINRFRKKALYLYDAKTNIT